MTHCRPTIGALVVAALLAANGAGAAADDGTLLPRPAALEPAVQFWARVYSERGTDAGFIHDSRYLDVIYTVVDLPAGESWREQQQRIRAVRDRYRSLLRAAARNDTPLNPEAARVRKLWLSHGHPEGLESAADRVRFQRGQANRFRAGLARSGAWRDYIRDTLTHAGVPAALAALPHVESSFDPSAYSHADAAGMWQFTPSTGRRFMQIDHVIDERLDPYLSTQAAAQLLRHNYEVTESWPLAITAYNHGAAGMRQAVERLGTSDIGEIVWRYDGRRFGFASRNFYAAFLAAMDVEARADDLFGPIARTAPRQPRIVQPADYLSVRTLANALGVDQQLLRALNPALLDPVWEGKKRWPRGFPLRLPPDAGVVNPDDALASIPATARYDRQVPDEYHRIRPGESLSLIAARYDTSVSTLMRINQLSSPHRIRAGATLRLPGSLEITPTLAAVQAPTARTTELAAVEVPQPEPLRAALQAAAPPPLPAAIPAHAPELASALTPAATPLPAPAPAHTPTALPAPADADALEDPAAAQDPSTTSVAGMPEALGADPSDFDVAADGTIEIQAFETLGHYAEWLDLRAKALRALNGLSYGRPLVVGQRLRLDLSRVPVAVFESRRRDYHRRLQAEYFSNHRINGVVEHRVEPGDSLWLLSQRFDSVPVWLLRQYNPTLNFDTLRPGTVVVVPVVDVRETPPAADHPDADMAARDAFFDAATSRSASLVGSGSR